MIVAPLDVLIGKTYTCGAVPPHGIRENDLPCYAVLYLGEDWGKFTPLDDEMRLSVGTAQDVVVKRTIDKNEQKRLAGNLFNREVVVKYEIENLDVLIKNEW
jgi:hypothetical protein